MRKKSVDSGQQVDQVAKMLENGYVPAVSVAHKMGVSLTTVSRWAENGEIEAETVGHRKFVKLSSLIKHIGDVQAKIFGFLPSEGGGKKQTKTAGDKL